MCLFDNGLQIPQTGVFVLHLARKYGKHSVFLVVYLTSSDLYGDAEEDAIHADLVFEGLKDFHPKYIQVMYRKPVSA